MSQLHDQIRHHYRSVDEAQRKIDWEEIVERLDAGTIEVSPLPDRRAFPITIGVAALMVVLVGVLGVITSPVNVSDSTPTSPTTVTTSPTSPTTESPSIPLGDLTWTRLTGDNESLPLWIDGGGAGAYFAFDPPPMGRSRQLQDGDIGWIDRLWRSDDALTWTYEENPQDLQGIDVGPLPETMPSVDETAIGVLPDGGFVALVNVNEDFHQIVGTAEDVQLWVTPDGVEWQQYAPLPFDLADSISVHLVDQADSVLLFIDLFDNPQARKELWATTDGINWQQKNVEFPRVSDVVQFDLGLAAFEGPEEGFWISTDQGVTWSHFASPVSNPSGIATMGATGDVLYIGTEIGSSRTLWIGRFEG
jgi:hypothetical protein